MPFPATEIFDRLQTWANHFPERPAHVTASIGRTGTTQLTYRQLLGRTRAVAGYLRARFPDDDSPVIVFGHKEPEMLAGFLGVLGSGRAYIPLDDSLPAHRVASVTEASGATLTLTPEFIASLSESDEAELLTPRADSPFYIIFTSGSTGDPKGVVITARCLDAFLNWMLGEHSFVEGGETFLNQAPFSFDLSVMDLYLSLTTGGTLYSVTRREIADFKSLFLALDAAPLTAWVSTPSFAQLCLAERSFARRTFASPPALPFLRRNPAAGHGQTPARPLSRGGSLEHVWSDGGHGRYYVGPGHQRTCRSGRTVTHRLSATGNADVFAR